MRVKKVKHIAKYLIEVCFENLIVKRIDLKKFLFAAINPMTIKFRNIKLFKDVKIQHGHLSWGNSEMDLSAESLYHWKN